MMNWFKAKKAYGYKNYEVLKIALYHTMGQLPVPESTHRFYWRG